MTGVCVHLSLRLFLINHNQCIQMVSPRCGEGNCWHGFWETACNNFSSIKVCLGLMSLDWTLHWRNTSWDTLIILFICFYVLFVHTYRTEERPYAAFRPSSTCFVLYMKWICLRAWLYLRYHVLDMLVMCPPTNLSLWLSGWYSVTFGYFQIFLT